MIVRLTLVGDADPVILADSIEAVPRDRRSDLLQTCATDRGSDGDESWAWVEVLVSSPQDAMALLYGIDTLDEQVRVEVVS